MIEKKKQNKVKIAKFIRYKGHTSKPEIAAELGISMPTVLQNVKELTESGIVEEIGEYESTGGRKAKTLSITASWKMAVGLDITLNHISMVILDLKGTITGKKRIRKNYENSYEYYRELADELDCFVEETGTAPEKILGVGISIPGVIDQSRELITRSHVLHLNNVKFQAVSQFIRYPVSFENDANSAALAEFVHRERDAVYLSLSNSVGGAIYVNRGIYAGDNFKSAEFGHMILEPDGKLCYCGKKGCMDAYCSARVLSDHTGDSLELFFQSLESGDKTIREIWNSYLSYLAIAVTNLRMAFDCDIILGGYIGEYIKPYMVELSRNMSGYNMFEQDALYLKNSRYGMEAAAVGGAMKYIEAYFETLS